MPVPKSRYPQASNAATIRVAGWSDAMLAAVTVVA